jgi:hypothetical protein
MAKSHRQDPTADRKSVLNEEYIVAESLIEPAISMICRLGRSDAGQGGSGSSPIRSLTTVRRRCLHPR